MSCGNCKSVAKVPLFCNSCFQNAKLKARKEGAIDFAKKINTEIESRLFRTDSARIEFIDKLIKKELGGKTK